MGYAEGGGAAGFVRKEAPRDERTPRASRGPASVVMATNS